MKEIKNEIQCPNCSEDFDLTPSQFDTIIKQVRDKTFEKAVNEQKEQLEKINKLEIAKVQDEAEKKIQYLMQQKDEEIAYYKDMKTRLSTKMVGETLELHCEVQFNQIRATAFPTAYFDKDNDAKTGTKGDYIYRDYDDEGNEIISIMFEMKNQNEETAKKHKNTDFLAKLDKDRKEKGCEYAILVSLLEIDDELYNTGIVDMSYKYPKMYVIRPQFFIPIITILKNAAQKAVEYQKELAEVKNQATDVENFETKLNEVKNGFNRNTNRFRDKFDSAVSEIDKTIEKLEKIKQDLLASDNYLRLANNKLDELTIKKLVKDNPTLTAEFEKHP